MTVGVISAVIRGGSFCIWLNSPLRFFHKVPGLDMETLLRFSEWGADKEFSPLFVVHRLLIYTVWIFNGKEHCLPALVLIQSLFGVLGAVLTADLVLTLWGKRIIALGAGIFYGIYSVVLLYDFCILQESITTTLILLGVWSYIRCKVRHYPSKMTFLSGILLGLSSIGRPVAFLLAVISPVKTFFDGKRKAALLLGTGVLTLWLAASTFNFVFSQSFYPFFRAVNYTMAFHDEKAAAEKTNVSPEKSAAVKRFALGLPCRAAQFFLAHEMPENINYYFIRSRIPFLKYLPGPGFLMPLALAGIFLMFLRLKHREGLILAVLFLLALPLAARDPIGRYRLHLIPYFVLSAAYFCVVLTRNTRARYFCLGAYVLAIGINAFFSPPSFIRVSDHIAWGKALEFSAGNKPVPAALNEYFRGWVKSRWTDRAAAVNLITGALKAGNVKLAVQTCEQGIAADTKEKSIYHYYLAVIFTSSRQFDRAENELRQINEKEIPALRKKIQYLRQVVKRKSF